MSKRRPEEHASVPAPLVATDEPTTKLVFGVTFNLHGTQVPISTDDVADAAKNGIEFRLPQAVDLGTLDDFVAWFNNQFGVAIPSANDLPPPLDKIIGLLTSLNVRVDQFHIKIPGTADTDQNKYYTLAMSAFWTSGEGIPLIPGVLTIDGAVFGVSNEPPKQSALSRNY